MPYSCGAISLAPSGQARNADKLAAQRDPPPVSLSPSHVHSQYRDTLKAGLAGVYDRANLQKKKTALTLWAYHLLAFVERGGVGRKESTG